MGPFSGGHPGARATEEQQMKKIGRAGSTFTTVVAAAIVLAVATTSGAVAGGLVTSKKIKNNTIKSIDVRNSTLTGADLANGAVTAAKLGTVVQRTNTVVVNNNSGASISVLCQPGERVLAGGADTAGVGTAAGWSLIRSGIAGNGWSATAYNSTGAPHGLVVEAYCLQ
jgi:hypothetical protein